MTSRIEDYALIGDCWTGALISRDGSIDWLCLPRFDSAACFAALLGTPDNGRWLLRPQGEIRSRSRRYRDETLVLETEFETDGGTVAVIDFMSRHNDVPDVVRIVEGRGGTVPMRMELVFRLDYGSVVPWVRRCDGGLVAVAGPDSLFVRTDVPMRGEDFRTLAEFDVRDGERRTFTLSWRASNESPPEAVDPLGSLQATVEVWERWVGACNYDGRWRDAVVRSLITLKALTFQPTGGMIAALTTSLPEQLGGSRNWDYRLCWLRDATLTLFALIDAGYLDEAAAWRDWLMRAVAGQPSRIQPLYGVAGERWLPEFEIGWLPGYERSRPVRVGNRAHVQLQLDVFGELMDTLHLARCRGLAPEPHVWNFQRALIEHLETVWREPDEGIWEVRGERRQFTYSKVMAWLAVDRAVKSVEQFQLDGPHEKWRKLRDGIHADVCKNGFNHARNSFTQSYGARHLDASLLVLPLVGFLPPSDPRIQGTVAAIERELSCDGFIRRYNTDANVDGLSGGEGVFLMCSFWLADVLALLGRKQDAIDLFERLLDVRNDVGLLAEEYDPVEKRFLGNFPQAFSHVALINTARNLSEESGPSSDRSGR
jgi:GH15 family glucan-1,4-alpha-glucosidase